MKHLATADPKPTRNRITSMENLLALSVDDLRLARLDRQAAAADPHEAIAACHLRFAVDFLARDAARLVDRFFTEDTHLPIDWSAPICVVKGRTALRALFEGTGRIHSIQHETQCLTVIDDYTAHELGWRQVVMYAGSPAVTRYAALWQYAKGRGWRVRQWLSGVDE